QALLEKLGGMNELSHCLILPSAIASSFFRLHRQRAHRQVGARLTPCLLADAAPANAIAPILQQKRSPAPHTIRLGSSTSTYRSFFSESW
ncbi:MAG TPA: hypothetical protein V6D12_22285, partial [Candidatus Obscuribacterales bacterium]